MFSKRVVSESDAVMEAGWKRRSRATAPPHVAQAERPPPHIPPRCPCRSRRCFPCFFDDFRAIFQAELPPRLLGCVRTGTLPFCVCISMGGRTCPKWAVFARFRFYGRCRIALAPANRAAWRRSRATAPPGASQRVAPSDEAPPGARNWGMCATIVFAPSRGATYCVHYIYARM